MTLDDPMRMEARGVTEAAPDISPARRLQARIRIAGTGVYMPATRRSSADIDRMLGRTVGRTEKRTGIAERPVADAESSSFMAAEAARGALAAAGLPAGGLDMILSASSIPEQLIPAMAPLVQARLGLGKSGIPCFDVNASCLSFVTAFDLAAQMIEAGRCSRILIVSSEIASRGLPWRQDPDTAAMFGDGAAAAVIGPTEGRQGGLVASLMESWSEGYHDCEVPAGGTRYDLHRDTRSFIDSAFFRMDGKAAYRLAARVVAPFLDRLLAKAGWRLADVDLVVPHQASRGAIDHLSGRLGIPRGKIVDILAAHGNQIAASIPTALHHAFAGGRIGRGSRVLVLGTSAGFSVGGLCLEMP
ncbi:3-oxoacyl-ACP synthase [Labrys miyagiensis]|uniref:3-oxoacyl-ACP synthase n=1 Tax=Labrys miyagiensis TaxID=346912 RepID=A0ABQ6CR63_9HYPH|nr:3-oxoacyl-[acyl-carrier-protein] synthase III C-terminal domain-containing protein [Labrys miyagiensis]GLS22305.1 3-oxoacyl-ACP synthase [Labrys miyagiensis]